MAFFIGKNHKESKQKGNVFFLILLAIILFAALAYAITNSLRGGGREVTPERSRTLASQIIQNANLLSQNMQRAMLINNIPEWGFDLSGTGSNALPNATCTQSICKMFTEGGIPPMEIPTWASADTTIPDNAKVWFYIAQIINVGTSAPELIYKYRFLTKEICDSINEILATTDVDLTVNDAWGGNTGYTNTLTSFPSSSLILGNSNKTLIGKPAFCMWHNSEGYTFVYSLLER